MEFREGQVLLFQGKSFYAKLIYIANRIKYKEKGYSHAAIIGEITKNQVIIYEAISNGFTKRPLNPEGLKKLILDGSIQIGTPKYKLSSVKRNCEKYLGRPYAWTDIFNLTLNILVGMKYFPYSTNAQALICSEAVARILFDSSLKQLNLEDEFDKRYDLITPMDLKKSKLINWRK